MSGAEDTHARGARVVVHDVRRVHPGPIVAVDGVSLALEPGEFVVLTGPSGSGKTSLLSIIGDLDRPTSGTVEVDGIAIADSPDGYLIDHSGYIYVLDQDGQLRMAFGYSLPKDDLRADVQHLLDS